MVLAGGFQPPYVLDMTNALAEQGAEVILIGGDIHRRGPFSRGVSFRNLRGDDSPGRNTSEKAIALVAYYLRTLGCIVRSRSRFVLTIYTLRPFIDGVCVNSLLRALGRKTFLIVHNIVPHGKRDPLSKAISRFIYLHAVNHLFVHSRHLAQRLRNEFGLSQERVSVIAHGIHKSEAGKAPSREVARKELSISADAFIVLVFGQITPYKGIDFLLKAISGTSLAKLRVLIRGRAETSYGNVLQKLIGELQLQSIVDCKFGFVDENDVGLLFSACNVLTLPYFEDSQSGALFMAYTYGRPVLACMNGSFEECIEPGKTGEIFPIGNGEALAGALKHMCDRSSAYDESYIMDYAERMFSWEMTATTLLQAIRGLCGV